jgi:predicted MPP superfamily phosphohydrolase
MISRRTFLKTAMAGGLIGAVSPYSSTSFSTEDLEITQVEIRNRKIPSSFNNYRIAFISDLHCGVFLSAEFLEKTVMSINRENPDVLILGGDYIGVPDTALGHFFSSMKKSPYQRMESPELVKNIFVELGKALKEIKSPDRIHAVMGNHDHWNNGDICVSVLGQHGVNFLINREHFVSRKTDRIMIYGTDDYWTGIPRLTDNFLNNHKDFKILISHNPDFISNTVRRESVCFDLALGGHTHGGQIYIKGLGPLGGYGVRNREFFTGTKMLGESIVHTSRGIGVVDVPYRVNSRPEITVFTLYSI